MNNAVKFVSPVTPEKSLAELARAAGDSIEQSTQALVGITAALLEQLKAVQNVGAAVEDSKIAPLYMSVSQALERYGICRTTFYQIAQLEGCPKLGKIGNKTVVPIAAFDKFFDELVMGGKEKDGD